MHRQRLFLLTAVMTAVLCASAMAVTHQYTGLWGKPGINLTSSTKGGVEITYSLDKVDITDVDVNGEAMQAVNIGGLYLPNQSGAPNLPSFSRYIAVPQGATATVELLADERRTIEGVNLSPAPVIPKDNNRDRPVYNKNAAIYAADKPYPEAPVEVSPPMMLRGVDAAMLRLTPFQYNPVTKQLTVYTNMRLRVTFTGGNGRFGDDRLRSRWWDPILAGNLANYRMLPEIDYTRKAKGSRDGYEYVIICPNEANCLAWADTIKQWRTLQGITTNIYTTDVVGPSAQQIETWINNAYNTWSTPPVAVLFIGDVPGQGFSVDTLTADYYSDYYEIFPSDNLYADVNGDHLPDINVARIEADVAADLPMMINKMLDMERNPYTSAGFYNNPISCVGYQSDRWFQLAGEVVYGFWKNHQGKAPVRRYISPSYPTSPQPGNVWSSNANTSTVIDYFGNPSHGGLGYINDTIPADITWTTSYSLINADINAGCFIVNHRDHGQETGWADPAYTQANALALTNTMFPFLFTINCLTGAYQQSGTYGQCLGEAFYRQSHGALGYIGPTEVSYSFVNDAFIWGIYDEMWPDFCPDLGDTLKFHDRGQKPGFAHVSGKLFLAASSWPYNPAEKNITYDLFHMHGDPFMTLYSEMPQDLTVSHPGVLTAGVTTFPVTADEGAFIALTVNGEIIGTGTAPAKGTANITIAGQTPGNIMVVTATKDNYRRYTANVPVTAASGPYVTHLRHSMSDAAGNGDGIANPGETVQLPTWVVNLGVAQATGVVGTLRTASPNGTVTDSVCNYGDIAAGDSAVYSGGFGVLVNPADSNGTTIPLELECRDAADSVWTASFSLTVGTGVLAYNGKGIGGNGRLDPNETARLGVSLKNNGLGYSYGTSAVLRCGNPLVTCSDSTSGYGTINPGATGASGADSFTVDIGAVAIGTSVGFTVVMKGDGMADRSYSWSEVVGDLRYSPTPDNTAGSPVYYAVEDSDGVGRAPVYSWAEIRGVGTALTGLLDDDAAAAVTLPFTFRWYGANYTALRACSNGWIAFGTNTSTAYSNTVLPTTTFTNGAVFALWNDLDGRAANAPGAWVGYYNDAANGRFIVEWDSIIHYGTTKRLKFQVMYYDSTASHPYYDVVVQYNLYQDDQGTSGYYSSVGFQQNGTTGAQLLFNQGYASTMLPLGDHRAVRLTRSAEPLGVAGGPGSPAGLPQAYHLGLAYPNPFKQSTMINYQIPKSEMVDLAVYNIAGQKVRTLVSGARPAGYHTARWDGRDQSGAKVSAGIYLFRLTTPAYTRTGKLSLVK